MIKVGITGGIGTGKSSVLNVLNKLGASTISADNIVHESFKKGQEVYKEIVREFGEIVLDEKGEINRKKLGQIVFQDQEKKELLEGITHPEVKKRILNFFSEQKQKNKKAAFAEVPLLFEVRWEKEFDQIWVVWAPQDVVRRRLVQKGFSAEEVDRRLRSKLPLAEKVKKADVVIENKGSLWELEKALQERWQKLNG